MVLKVKYLEENDFITEKDIVICLGYFDGMHIAHINLIKQAKDIAKDKGLSLAVFTFSRSIRAFMKREKHRCLTTIDDKISICEKLGVDYLYVMKVSKELIHMEAYEFIDRFLLKSNTVVVGFDFSFGYLGKGDSVLLKQNKNFDTLVVEEMKFNDIKVGSTRIVKALEEGKLELANYLLGRPFFIKGEVVLGRGIGKKLGYPTANIDYLPYYLPKSGVYFTRISYQDKLYYGITNVGNKPTYNNLPISVETHVFGIYEDFYNKEMKLEFLEFIRPEIKFDSEEDLSKQIYKDIEEVKVKIKEANNA